VYILLVIAGPYLTYQNTTFSLALKEKIEKGQNVSFITRKCIFSLFGGQHFKVKYWCKNSAYTFSYMVHLDNDASEMESVAPW
jgi:hypothetical protein